MTISFYYNDGLTLTWLAGYRLDPGITPARAAQCMANAITETPSPEAPADDYHGRLAQMRRGALAPNWWRCGSREGKLPQPDGSGVEAIGRDMRDAHLQVPLL